MIPHTVLFCNNLFLFFISFYSSLGIQDGVKVRRAALSDRIENTPKFLSFFIRRYLAVHSSFLSYRLSHISLKVVIDTS